MTAVDVVASNVVSVTRSLFNVVSTFNADFRAN